MTVVILSAVVMVPANSASAIQMIVGLGILMLVPSHLFSADENAHLDLLYGLLPLRRGTVVTGRYATILATIVISACIGTAVALIGALVRDLPAGDLGVTAVYLVAVMLGLQGVQTPLYFKLGYAKARIVTMALLVATVIGFFALLSFALPNTGASELDWNLLIPLGALAAGTVLFIASALLSARWYRAREL